MSVGVDPRHYPQTSTHKSESIFPSYLQQNCIRDKQTLNFAFQFCTYDKKALMMCFAENSCNIYRMYKLAQVTTNGTLKILKTEWDNAKLIAQVESTSLKTPKPQTFPKIVFWRLRQTSSQATTCHFTYLHNCPNLNI